MTRKFSDIPLEDFKEKVRIQAKMNLASEYYDNISFDDMIRSTFYGIHRFSSVVGKDLSKIVFDFENVECTKDGIYDEGDGLVDLLNFGTLSNGMVYLGITAGGDWEYPLFFILYWNGKNIRGYIPTDGNTWNKEFKTAYGSEEDSNKYDKKIENLTYVEKIKLREELENFVYNPPAFVSKLVIQDIMNRIQKKD